MQSNPPNVTGRKRFQAKWALAMAALLVAYGLIQPLANARLGWNLPTLASFLSQGEPLADRQAQGSSSTSAVSESPYGMDAERSAAAEQTGLSKRLAAESNKIGTFGYLREIGGAEYLSPAGLRYGKGSQEGHRLKHLARHLEDQPDRPGSHGVFIGDMHQVLVWLDDAYQRAARGAPGTSQSDEQGRTVYEAKFAEPIGFVGGQQGRRSGNPDASSIRLVTEGNRLITAFPF